MVGSVCRAIAQRSLRQSPVHCSHCLQMQQQSASAFAPTTALTRWPIARQNNCARCSPALTLRASSHNVELLRVRHDSDVLLRTSTEPDQLVRTFATAGAAL